MEILVILVPLALDARRRGLVAFLWSLRSGQYDDLDGAAGAPSPTTSRRRRPQSSASA
jgi:cbb3-type cytochrome oxidase maturation protein